MGNEISIQVRLSGHFKMEAVRPDGSRRLLADWQDNLITDAGLNRIGDHDVLTYCHVGTGSSAPDVGDTALNTWLAVNDSKVGDGFYSGSPHGAQATAPYYGWTRGVYRFAAGTATGNITEVGLSGDNTNINMFCRALTKDGEGAPTTVTVLADEMLDITYEVRMYPSLEDTVSVVNISGVDYTFTCRAAYVTFGEIWGSMIGFAAGCRYGGTYGYSSSVAAFLNGTLGTITQGIQGATNISGSLPPPGGSNDPYVPGSLQRDFTATWSTSYATNPGGVDSFEVSTTKGAYQIVVSPTIPKTAVNNLSLKFRVSWGRYTP